MIIAGLTTTGASSTASATFLGPYQTTQSTATESNVQLVVPLADTVAHLAVSLGSSPGNGNSWTFTINKNGKGTAVTCQVTNNNSTCTDPTHTVSFATGDLLSLEALPGKTAPTNWGSARWSVTLSG
jgi:hypothetical protein